MTTQEKLEALVKNIIPPKTKKNPSVKIQNTVKPGEIQISFEGEDKFVKAENPAGLTDEDMEEIMKNLEKAMKESMPF